MKNTSRLRIGTRKSPLARKQTDLFCKVLKDVHPDLNVEIIPIETFGDTTQKQNLSLFDHGGKALWASEHEAALRANEIDCAVHSTKDVPGILDDDMDFSTFLKREDPRDVLITGSDIKTIHDLPQGAKLGTSSPRRAAYALDKRPDLIIETFRGNVGTRLQKIKEGIVDASFLAAAGLVRMGYDLSEFSVLDVDDMIPAVGQGAIGIEFLKTRTDLKDLLMPTTCTKTSLCITAERSWLHDMGGSCRSPLAAHAFFNAEGHMHLNCFVSNLAGTETRRLTETAIVDSLEDASILGARAAEILLKDMPNGFL